MAPKMETGLWFSIHPDCSRDAQCPRSYTPLEGGWVCSLHVYQRPLRPRTLLPAHVTFHTGTPCDSHQEFHGSETQTLTTLRNLPSPQSLSLGKPTALPLNLGNF